MALEKGSKIRQASWPSEHHVELADGSIIHYTYSLGIELVGFGPRQLLAEDWQVIEL